MTQHAPARSLTTLRQAAASLAALTVAACVAACVPHTFRDADKLPVAVPETFDRSGAAPRVDRWWKTFEDPELDQLVARALADGLELRSAWGRLAQAEAVATQSSSGLWPSLDATVSAGRSRRAPPVERKSGTSRFVASLAASYEVDVWGRVRSNTNAHDLELAATREDLEAVAMSLVARAAETWFALVEQRAQLALLRSQLEVNRTFLELVEARFEQGLASALDVYQQKQLRLAADRRLKPVQARIEVLEHELAVLVGQPPNARVAKPQLILPSAPPVPTTGLTAELLKRRPDVRAAHNRVAAADHRVAAAIADRFPALRLTAEIGLQATDLADLVNGFIWGIAGSLVMPVIDGKRRVAKVDEQRAVLEQRLSAFGQTVLVSIREVEDALVLGEKQVELLSIIDQEVEVANAALDEARNRYVQGLGDYLPVLTALRTAQESERDRLSARRQLLSHRIQLYRALGGSWTNDLGQKDGETTS